MNNNDLLALFHKELRYEAYTAGYTREETSHVVRHISNHRREKGFIIASNLTVPSPF